MFGKYCAIFSVQIGALLVSADITSVPTEASCIANADLAIAKSAEKEEDKVTSSKLFKRHLAEYFCKLGSPRMTVLELGVHHGYSTAVWASIFQKVIAVDLKEELLRVAAARTAKMTNVVFLAANLMADSWTTFRNNRVDAVIIDANHDYHHVRADAYNSLRHLPYLRHMAFHDLGTEEGVLQTVRELSGRRILRNCRKLGQGWDGSSWSYNLWDPATGAVTPAMTNLSEGVACRSVKPQKLQPPFANLRYLVLGIRDILTLCCPSLF